MVDFPRGRINPTIMSKEGKTNSAFMKPVQPDEALAKIVGSHPLPRTELTKKSWEYIKKHNLQHKKQIKADTALEAVFNGKNALGIFHMPPVVDTDIVK